MSESPERYSWRVITLHFIIILPENQEELIYLFLLKWKIHPSFLAYYRFIVICLRMV